MVCLCLTVTVSKNCLIYHFWLSYLYWCFTFHSLVFFSLSVCLSSCPPHSSVILAYTFFIPLPPSLCDLVGHRPYGLEEDVRQYEQDLAKRLYQARVRASQGTAAAPQPPTSSSTSSSAASQLRSAPRPRPPGPDARHRGVVLGCFDIWGTLLEAEFGKVQASTRSNTDSASAAFPVPYCFCTSLLFPISSSFWFPPLFSFLCLVFHPRSAELFVFICALLFFLYYY